MPARVEVVIPRSRTADRRKLEAKKAKPCPKPLPIPDFKQPFPIPDTPAKWRWLLKSLPSYDPYSTKTKCVFDSARAEKAIRFFHEQLTHVKGEKARSPFWLERWQMAVIANLFGWKLPDGRRRYQEAFIFVPRKNGKTCLAAGIVLYGLFMDGEPGAEIYGAASEFKQASLVFQHARGMVTNNERLDDQVKIIDGTQARGIRLESDRSFYAVISSETGSAHGYNSHMAVIDELHALPDRSLVDVLATSLLSRRNPMLVHITTSDFERPNSICNAKHKKALEVCSGTIDDAQFLPVVYEAQIGDDWHDIKIWKKANPNFGVSVDRENFARLHEQAITEPSFENTFKRLYLNIRTQQEVRWIPLELWDSGDDVPDIEDGMECYGAFDLASTQDTTAAVLIFPLSDGLFGIQPHFWIPADTARERERKDRVPYLTWARQGYMTLTPGNVCDYNVVRRDINQWSQQYDVKEWAYDPWNARHLAQQLGEEDGMTMVEFRQGYVSMSEPSKSLERLLLAGKIRHGNHPVLRWQAGNVAIKIDPAGNIKPDKAKSAERIDGIVGTVMALGRAMLKTEKPKAKVRFV